MTAPKDMVLQDLPNLFPGLTRAGIEQVLRTLAETPLGGGNGYASQLISLAPDIAARLKSLTDQPLDAYIAAMNEAGALILRMWPSNTTPPPLAAILGAVEALFADGD